VAMLALASQAAGGGDSSDMFVQNLRSMPTAPSYVPAMPTGPGTPGHFHYDLAPDHLPRSFQMPAYTAMPKEDVLGVALPGLAVCMVIGRAHDLYTRVRNTFLQSQTSRTAADTCAAAGILASMLLTYGV
jgi:hypothetical protein